MAALSVAICLVLAGIMIWRDAGGAPAVSRWRIAIAVVEGALWIAAALIVAPTLWGLLS